MPRIYSVATFYALFNLEPQGRDTISVCRGTACHTRGSRDLFEKLLMNFGFPTAREARAGPAVGHHADGSTTLRTVACFGQCALAPVVEVNHAIFGHMNEQALQRELEAPGAAGAQDVTRIRDDSTFNAVRKAGLAKLLPSRPRIAVGMGTCGTGNGAEGVYHAFADAIGQRGLDVQLAQTGCFGFCAEEPLVNVWLPGQPLRHAPSRPDRPRRPDPRWTDGTRRPRSLVLCKIEQWDHVTAQIDYGRGHAAVPPWDEVPFFKGQKKIVLRNCGLINPDDIEEYIAIGGYQSLHKVLLDGTPEMVNEQIKAGQAARPRRRGLLDRLEIRIPPQRPSGDRKYLICNADEGDPGAYMNRNEIESDPHSLLEGMAIGGYVTGAAQGSSMCAPNIRWRCIG